MLTNTQLDIIFGSEISQLLQTTEIEDETLPLLIGLRRSSNTICKYCNTTFGLSIPQSIRGDHFICYFCANKITYEAEKVTTNLRTIVHYHLIIRPQIHSQIIDIAFLPNRVLQTRLFDYDWK